MIPKYEKAHIKKIDTLGKYSVWLVDGEYIRREINENFVAFDAHDHFDFIPKDEFWIDMETDPADRPFFIDHLIVERGFIDAGYKYKDALKKADAYEKTQREKAIAMTNLARLKSDRKKLIEEIHEDHLKEYEGEVAIWLVDGFLVRDFFLVEYAEGGHDRVYPFIPDGEIWIERVLSEDEQKFIILHELHERYLMGQGKSYLHAHKGATIIEDHFRDHPEGIMERIAEELEKNTA